MDDDDYKFVDDPNKESRFEFQPVYNDISEMDKSKQLCLFQKYFDQIQNIPDDHPNKLEETLDILNKASILISLCNCEELSTLFLSLSCHKLIFDLINANCDIVDPITPILFIANSLSLPGLEIGDKYLDLGLFDFIMGKAAEDIPIRPSIIALNNIIPNLTNEEQITAIKEVFPLERIFDVNVEECSDLIYPLLFLAKTLYKKFNVEFNEEHVGMFNHLLDQIFSSDDDFIQNFDNEDGFYPLLNTFILDIPPISFSLPVCFLDHIIQNSLSFNNYKLSLQCISIACTIVKNLKKYTPSNEPIRTELFVTLKTYLENEGFLQIIPQLSKISTSHRSSFYIFIYNYGKIYPKIYSDDYFLPFVQFIQEDFQVSFFSIKKPIIKILRKFIQILSNESFPHLNPQFIESLVSSIDTTDDISLISIKFLQDLYVAFNFHEEWETIKGLLLECNIIDILNNIIDDNEDDRLCECARSLLTILFNSEEEEEH